MKNTRLPIIGYQFNFIQWIFLFVFLFFFSACSHEDITHKDLNQLLIILLGFLLAFIIYISRRLYQARTILKEKENTHIINLSNEEDLREMNFIQTEIYLKLKEISSDEKGKMMTQEDWITLELELNNIYNNFAVRLKSCCEQISETELRVCYLLKAGFSVTSIAKIIGRTKSAVSMSRKRLLEKINRCDCPATDLDDFITTI
ncbi:helix-turn-helix transcriptional regulator [Macellibacteroides fermentans]|uniref:Ca2+/Na+ antiporter n=1 Tax=Macellibacteroides fermentans TaxID=879969 RepID=A0A8E1ZYC4_9PORP|nr:hypothetical protein [Macellibacteroides fermentans]NYI50025.1 Ca2+/Na+ antiporter [Macellibacteroides fermentans]